jgi:hypothetical protein
METRNYGITVKVLKEKKKKQKQTANPEFFILQGYGLIKKVK